MPMRPCPRTRLRNRLILTTTLILGAGGLAAQGFTKADLSRHIADNATSYSDVAMAIWEWAEPGYQEVRSSALLQDTLQQAGFTIDSGVAGIPTAFVATHGEGRPVIGILAEFDALPGLGNQAVAEKLARSETDWGHACGHHLFGAGSTAAAIAISEAISAGAIEGTIRLYGTPAEEGGGAKVFMTRAGLFDDVDAVLHWHCGSANSAGDPSSQARVAAKFRFHGRSAHAAASPEQGRSALDAVELMNHAAQLLREHTPDLSRIHHVITDGGRAPNVVPDFAEVYYYARHPDAKVAADIYRRLVLCAEGAALATETELEIEYLGGVYNTLPNNTLSAVTLSNLQELNDLSYDAEESAFAEQIQATLGSPLPLSSLATVHDRTGMVELGSTDVGDVSWTVPTTGLDTACWVPGTPAHSWQATAAGATSIGEKGMLLAARSLAATAWDLFQNPETLRKARAELDARLALSPYIPMLEEGQEPPLDYRDAPSGR